MLDEFEKVLQTMDIAKLFEICIQMNNNDKNGEDGDFIKECLDKNKHTHREPGIENGCEVAEVKNMYGIVKQRNIC